MGQENGRDDERPAHRVTVAPFLLCRFQATNAHWEAFRKATGREKLEFAHEIAPATSVNWFDAMAYCHWLSAEWGRHVRLPSEAEWECAARGGVEGKLYPWGDAARVYGVGLAGRPQGPPAHRSRMGIRGARRGGGEALSVGR